MRFPKFGHTHPSFFAHGDVKVRLDARPWPVLNPTPCWPGDCDWACEHSIVRRYGSGPGNFQNMPRVYGKHPALGAPYGGLLRENLVQSRAVDLDAAARSAGFVPAGDGALADTYVPAAWKPCSRGNDTCPVDCCTGSVYPCVTNTEPRP